MRAWLRSTGPLLVALPVLIVLLSLGGYLVTSRTMGNDREEEAEQRAQVVGLRTEGFLGRVRAYSSGLGGALATEPEARQDIFVAVAGRWGAAAGLADALWVERAGSRLIVAYTKRISGDLHPGVDVSDWAGLAPEVSDRSTMFAVRASSLGLLNSEPGFYVVDGASFGRRAGFLALFVPRGWLTNALELNPQEVAIDVDGRRLDGALESRPSATTSFEALGRSWGIGVGRQPLTGLQTILPWLAVAWPIAAALVAFLIGRAILLRRRAERDVERMFDVTVDAMCVAGIDGYFKRVNPGYARMLGYSQQELLSRPFSDFTHPDDLELANEAMGALARGEKVVGLELRNIARDGSERWLQWNTQPVPDEGVVYATARDVTERRRAAEEEAALRRVATLVAQGAPSADVLDAVAAEVCELLGADSTRLLRYEPDGTVTVLAIHGDARAPDGARWAYEDGNLASSVMSTGRPARTEFEHDPELPAGLASQSVRSGVGAPITVEGRLWGLIVALFTTRDPASAEDAETRMAAFTELVATAIANTQSRAELAASRARIAEASDETRRRIGRDLHDGTQQRLVAMSLSLRGALAQVPPELGALGTQLGEIAGNLADTTKELRDLARGIHPAVLTRGGLDPALKTLARQSALPVKLDVEGVGRLPERVEIAAYYVVSEALTNAAKHAHASAVEVTVAASNSYLELTVKDDGVGGADPDRGSGLIGLRDRVEAVGGTIHFESERGKGTKVVARIPTAPPESA